MKPRVYTALVIIGLTTLAFGALPWSGSAAGEGLTWRGVFTENVAPRTVPFVAPAPLPLEVNSTGDASDATPGDGLCATAGAVCTLRAAIEESNAVNDTDTINFLIPGVGVQTIAPASALPTITQPVTINGYTQTGSSVNTLAVGDNAVINIQIDGTGAGALVDGLRISGGNCTVQGLAIYKFAGDGIEILTNGNNTIAGNFIGTNATGVGTTNGNSRDGLLITNIGTNTIGGSTPATRNVISANALSGVEISGASATGNLVKGNYIGTDRNGTADVGNLNDGVFVGGPSNTIGGSTTNPGQGEGNVISGNTLSGVRITTNGNTNTVEGNLIGLQANGTTALANSLEGVFITNGASSNTIGGTSSELRNVISGNNVSAADGVEINGSGTNSNKVQGNYIGTNAAGTGAVPNAGDGVKIASGAQSNTIGGLTSTPGTVPGNVISGNSSDGIEIINAASSSNAVQGNLIGFQTGGTAVLRNGSNGILINGAASNTVGGSTTTSRNIITGGTASGDDAIDIQADASDNNVISGNYIGTNISGTSDFGAGGDGIRLSGTGPDNNTIGGSTSTPGTAPGNVISGNDSDGIEMVATSGNTTNGNIVRGNLIGLQADGTTSLGNTSNGVLINTNASSNTVGGTAANEANVIAFNGADGVSIIGGTGNLVRRNSIYSNTDLGIDLGTTGVTPNDAQDPDTGPNNLQNFPIITSANFNTQVIVGRLNSTPGQTFTIDFYKNPTCDGTNGEGKTHLGSLVTGTTDANGDVTFTFNSPTTFTATDVITATATDTSNNTSEFSACATPTAVRLTRFNANSFSDGVELSWESGFEINNLGYHLYREINGRRSRVTPSIIAGSALSVGAGSRLTAGYSYSWFDPQGTPSTLYVLEAIDLNGTLESVGPIYPSSGPNRVRTRKGARPDQAMLLNEISTEGTDQNSIRISGWPAATNPTQSASNAGFAASLSSDPGLLETQQSIAARHAARIAVRKNGWYRITRAELAAAGFDLSSDARNLQLYLNGVEVPMSLSTEGAQLGANDSIEFYGVSLDTPSTDTQIYYLVPGVTPGKRMLARRGKLKPADNYSEPAPGGFDFTVEREENLVYFSSLLNGEDENIFGSSVRSTAVTQTLPVKSLDADSVSQPQLEVTIQGVTAGTHQVQIQVNGANVGTMTFAEREHATSIFPVPPAALHEGDNSVSLVSLNGQSDVSLLDWVRLTYPRQYRADNNALRFSVPGGQSVRIDGFTSANVRVIDVTDPESPVPLAASAARAGNNFSVKVQPSGKGVRTLLAMTEDQIQQPAAITVNQPSTWNDAANGADMVIVTHKNFRQSVEPLATLRRNQGLSVAIVDVEDIFDEFSYGAHDPSAIKAFLMSASTGWTRKPAYVLLVGDSSWDPRNYLNQGDNDFVPTRLIDTQAMETGSDDWFVDFNNSGLPSLSIGRLPVRTAADANLLVSKIIAYEQERETNAPLRGAVMVSDTEFGTQTAKSSALLPSNLTVQTIDRAQVGNDDIMRGQILSALNQGPTLVNYFGHGSVRVWTGSGLLSSDLASSLTNGNRLSVFVLMTCLNGYASDANVDSLAESLLEAPNGGAMAVWASSGFTTPQPQSEINSEFYRLLFGSEPIRLGDAARRAKAATEDRDVRRTWTLLGDPTMRIR